MAATGQRRFRPSPFSDAVRSAARGTPYVVTDTARGFDVSLDIADPQWSDQFAMAGLTRVWTQHVVKTARGYRIEDEARGVDWSGGASTLMSKPERSSNLARVPAREPTWREQGGRIGPIRDLRFDQGEGRELVDVVAAAVGVAKGLGPRQRIALALLLVLGFLVVVAIVALVIAVQLGKV